MAIMDFTIGRTLGTESTRIKSYLLALCLGCTASAFSQCDLELVGVDLIEGTVTVAFNSTDGCGGTGGPDGISEIQFGFQALDEDCNAMNIGWSFPWGFQLSGESSHPGWIYSATTTESPTNWTNNYDDSVDPPYYAGEVVDFPIYNVYNETSGGIWYQMEDILNYWIDEGYSIQVVIWQISYGVTMYAADGGWAEVGPNGDGTSWGSGLYEDGNFQDNWIVIGPCGECVPETVTDTVYVELPPDTIVETIVDTLVMMDVDTVVLTDTIVVPINWYFYDTTYIYLTDTVVVNDTSYITLFDTTYITETEIDTVWWTVYETDTLTTYEYDMVEVDCNTGQPCVTPYEDCEIYIPNSFTPDNDGVNDVWGAVTDSFCWASWRMKVFSRSGEVIWESYDPDDIWLGGDEYYIPDGTYIYRVEAEGYGQSYIINGHVTILR